MTENLRLVVACLVALASAPLLATGWALSAAGRQVYALADRISPSE